MAHEGVMVELGRVCESQEGKTQRDPVCTSTQTLVICLLEISLYLEGHNCLDRIASII